MVEPLCYGGVDLFVLCVAWLTIYLGVVAIMLLNVMEVFSMGGGALLDRPMKVCGMCVISLLPPYVLFMFLHV